MFQKYKGKGQSFYKWIKMLLWAFIFWILVACGSDKEDRYDGASSSSVNEGGSSSSGGSSLVITKSLAVTTPVSDVLKEISYFAGGGAGFDCSFDCFSINGNRIILSDYEGNKELRILVYYPTPHEESSDGSIGTGTFVTEWEVQVDVTGSLELVVTDGEPSNYDYIVHDNETREIINLIGNNYAWGGLKN